MYVLTNATPDQARALGITAVPVATQVLGGHLRTAYHAPDAPTLFDLAQVLTEHWSVVEVVATRDEAITLLNET